MGFLNLLKSFALNAAAEGETAEKISQDILIDFSRFPETLKHMGIGMLSIFLVIGIIILSVLLLNKVTSRKKKEKSSDQ